jgi:hypothetical protein
VALCKSSRIESEDIALVVSRRDCTRGGALVSCYNIGGLNEFTSCLLSQIELRAVFGLWVVLGA